MSRRSRNITPVGSNASNPTRCTFHSLWTRRAIQPPLMFSFCCVGNLLLQLRKRDLRSIRCTKCSCYVFCEKRLALIAILTTAFIIMFKTDAAHTIHPLAGQGINLGLQDVAVLAQEIVAGHHCAVGPGQLELLRRYQRRRKGENLLMMSAMDGFKRLFEQQSLPLRWLRNAGMRQVDQLLPLKQQLMRHAMGLG